MYVVVRALTVEIRKEFKGTVIKVLFKKLELYYTINPLSTLFTEQACIIYKHIRLI